MMSPAASKHQTSRVVAEGNKKKKKEAKSLDRYYLHSNEAEEDAVKCFAAVLRVVIISHTTAARLSHSALQRTKLSS